MTPARLRRIAQRAASTGLASMARVRKSEDRTEELERRVERLENMLQAMIMVTGQRPWLGDVKAWPADGTVQSATTPIPARLR